MAAAADVPRAAGGGCERQGRGHDAGDGADAGPALAERGRGAGPQCARCPEQSAGLSPELKTVHLLIPCSTHCRSL